MKFIFLLAGFLVISGMLTSCAAEEEGQQANPSPAAAATLPENSPIGTQAPAITPDLTQAEERMEGMMPILDSIVRAMGVGGTVAYAPKDGEFFWNVLYLMGENWGTTHSLVTKEDDTVIVPRKVMQEFASAAFLDYSDLLPVPESMAQSVQYDEGLDAYRLAPSDMGNTSTRLEDVCAGADGAICASVALYEEPDTLLGTLEFTLADNPYVDGIRDPSYFYSVSGVQR